jgi:hypothetical protein
VERTKIGQCVWRGYHLIDKVDVKNVLLFIFSKREEVEDDQCPSVLINAGSHGNAKG